MEALDTQFPDDGLGNRGKENELNDDLGLRDEADLSGDEPLAEDVDGLEVDVDDPVDLGF